ncbi:MAG: carbohydrate-binding domain-containing protein [Anaerolineae bacterium]
MTASSVVEVAPPRQSRVWATPGEGGWLRSEDGRVDLRAPAGAVARRTELRYVALAGQGLPPNVLIAFDLDAVDEQGQAVHQFDAPLRIGVPLRSIGLTALQAAGHTLATFDPGSQRWMALATTIDPVRQQLLTTVDHFSTFGVMTSESIGIPAQPDRMSIVRGAQVSLFTRSIVYGQAVSLPPGRGGLTPALGLNYNSANHSQHQGHLSYVGHGWSLAGADSIFRDPNSISEYDHYLNGNVTMSLHGQTYTLQQYQGSDGQWRFFAKEDPLLKIDYSQQYTVYGGVRSFEFKVRTREGLVFTYRGAVTYPGGNSISIITPMEFVWGGNSIDTNWRHLYWTRLPLIKVEDLSGNTIDYSWTYESCSGECRPTAGGKIYGPGGTGGGPGYVRAIGLSSIGYNGGRTSVEFAYNGRVDRPNQADDPNFMKEHFSFYTTQKLYQITVKALREGMSSADTIRTVKLEHAQPGSGAASQIPLLLTAIVELSGAQQANLTDRVSFSYFQLNYVYPCTKSYLNQIQNMYGGTVAFDADPNNNVSASCTEDDWQKLPKVKTRTETPLPGGVSYTTRYGSGAWHSGGKGYESVCVGRIDPVTGLPDGAEQHEFNTIWAVGTVGNIDHAAGREKSVTQWSTYAYDSNSDNCSYSSPLARTQTDWGYDYNDSNAPYLAVPFYTPANVAELFRPRFIRIDETRTYAADASGVLKPLQKTKYYYDRERQIGPGQIASTAKQYGNLTRVEEYWGKLDESWLSTPLRTTATTYNPNGDPNSTTSVWIIAKPAVVQVYEGFASGTLGTLRREQRLWYDNLASYTARPTQGRLTRDETMWVESGAAGSQSRSMRYGYDTVGNLVWSRDPFDAANRETTFYYDRWFKAYPVCQRNGLGHTAKTFYYGVAGSETGNVPAECVTANGPASFTGNQFGQVYQTTDANAVTTTYGYDALGRLTKMIVPPNGDVVGNPATRVYDYRPFSGAGSGYPFWILEKQRDDSGDDNYHYTWTYYDGFGRVLQTKAEADASGSTARHAETSFDYTWRDALWHEGVPRFVNGSVAVAGTSAPTYAAPNWNAADQIETVHTYDQLGRLSVTVAPNSKQVRRYYNVIGDAQNRSHTGVAVIDEADRQTIYQTDPFGRLVVAKQYTNSYAGGPNWTDTPYTIVRYDNNVADQLVTVAGVDPDGTGPMPRPTTQISYDGFGQKVSMTDPDMGAWSYGYDSAGNLTRQTDARNQRTCFYFDTLNRLKGKTYSTGAAACPADPGSYLVSYSYDGGTNGKGRRTGMVDPSGSTAWEYDVRGRMTKETKVISGAGGGTFVTQWTAYDSMDRVRSMVYPDNEGVTFSYTAQGPIKTIYGSSTYYVGETLYNPLGQVTDRYLGSTAGLIRQKYTYTQAENYRLTALQSGVASAYNNLQNLSYTYDAVGNVTSIADAVNSSQRQCYTYDALHRLTRGFTTGATTCNNNANTVGSGPFDEAYGYDDALGGRGGNLTNKGGVIYTYNDVKPHAVRTGWGGSNRSISFWIVAKGVSNDGVWPQMTLRVNGVDRQTWVVNNMDYESFLAKNVAVTGNDVLEIVYSNDSGSRDLYVQHVKVGDIEWWPNENMIYDRGSGATAFDGLDVIPGQEAMYWNGALRFVGGTQAFAAGYDANGNMTHRVRYGEGAIEFIYDAENRLTQATRMGLAQATFVYDGDGNRVKATFGSMTTVYVGSIYERDNGSAVRKYYYAGGVRVAMRTGGQTYYLLGDHLGGTNVTANSSGVQISKLLYKPWGETRFTTGTTPTTWRFTGQREDATIGLYLLTTRDTSTLS